MEARIITDILYSFDGLTISQCRKILQCVEECLMDGAALDLLDWAEGSDKEATFDCNYFAIKRTFKRELDEEGG